MELETDWGSVGMRISKLRAEHNMSSADLAKHLNLTASRVAQIQNGQSITLEVLMKISQIFDISLEYLLNGDNGYGNVNIYNTNLDPEITELDAYSILSEETREALEYAQRGNFYKLNNLSRNKILSELNSMIIFAEGHLKENKDLRRTIETYKSLLK
jgi:transcriptional regulator with XRE-family HTH domain